MKSLTRWCGALLATVAAAASLVLAMGALAGCSADDPVLTAITSDEPAPADAPEAGPERSEQSDEVPPGQPYPADSRDAGKSGSDQSEDGDAHGAQESGSDQSGSDQSEDGAVTSGVTSSQQTSAGPVLEWTEIDPGFDDLFELRSVGDGRVMARVWNDGDRELFGQRIVVSADGKGWAEVPMPADLFPEQVNLSADRWVVTGRIPDVDRSDIGPDRMFFSDDHGATWTEVAINIPAEAFSPYAGLSLRASSVLVSGERIVVPLVGLPSIDGQALLDDLGLLPPDKRVIFSLPTPNGVSFTLTDAEVPYPYGDLTSAAFSLVSTYGALVITDWPDVAYDELDMTYDEVGLTFDEVSGLSNPLSNPFDVLKTRLYVSDGSSGEVAASFGSLISSAAATGEGFVLIAVGDSGGTVLSSPDGLSWSEGPSLGSGFFAGTISADGTIWTVMPGPGGSFAVQRAIPGQELATVATLDGLRDLGLLVVGPAGLVVVAERDASRSLRTDRGLPPEGRVARDGYELRYNETEGSLTLWDLAADTMIYAFGPDEMRSAELPDGVRVIDDGRAAGVVFEDPETGADLVTFTEEDMAFLVGMATAELEGASGGDPERPELWMGWSADGTAWGWQSLADAFGIRDAIIWPDIAVGQDFVIARVAAWEGDPAGVTQALPPRWFLATVP